MKKLPDLAMAHPPLPRVRAGTESPRILTKHIRRHVRDGNDQDAPDKTLPRKVAIEPHIEDVWSRQLVCFAAFGLKISGFAVFGGRDLFHKEHSRFSTSNHQTEPDGQSLEVRRVRAADGYALQVSRSAGVFAQRL
jgi:hypothetical protein